MAVMREHLNIGVGGSMSWQVVFTGLICLLAAAIVAAAGFAFEARFPWAIAVSASLALGIAFGGIKAVLDMTKAANELRKMGYEMEKLRLEISEKHVEAQQAMLRRGKLQMEFDKLRLEISEKQRSAERRESPLIFPTASDIRYIARSMKAFRQERVRIVPKRFLQDD